MPAIAMTSVSMTPSRKLGSTSTSQAARCWRYCASGMMQAQICRPQALRPSRCQRATRGVRCSASLRARWCLDARYGCKQEATLLLQEWVQSVGCSAGLTAQNTRLSSGALGVPESRLEMEVTFDSMADFEAFLSKIPFQDHKAWTQRIASMVVDGSPVWQVHRSIPLPATPTAEVANYQAVPAPSSTSAPKQLVFADQISTADMAAWEQLKRDSGSSSSGSRSSGEVGSPASPATPTQTPSEDAGVPMQRDWKGDLIKFSPGDKLPFKFL